MLHKVVKNFLNLAKAAKFRQIWSHWTTQAKLPKVRPPTKLIRINFLPQNFFGAKFDFHVFIVESDDDDEF